MRSLLFLINILFISLMAQAQETPMTQSTRDQINLSGLKIPNTGFLYGFEGPAGQLLGDAYLDTTFRAGNIRFYGRIGQSDSLGGIPIRLDLMSNEVEIRVSTTDIRVAKGPSVRQFTMNNAEGSISRFVNVREYRGEADALYGFFERLTAGPIDLLLYPSVSIKKANFNPALNVGTKDDQLTKKTDWYLAKAGRATRFSPGRKAILDLLADRKEAVETFLKTEKPDLKTRSGLMAVVAYYNRL